jgi:hypothetical protein
MYIVTAFVSDNVKVALICPVAVTVALVSVALAVEFSAKGELICLTNKLGSA